MTQPHPLPMQTIPELHVLEGTFPQVRTFLFDMDGTLFDTEKYHTLSLQMIGRDYQIRPPVGPEELHALMMGKADHLVFEIVKDWAGFPKDWTVKEFVDAKNKNLLALLSKVDGTSYFPVALKKLLQDMKAKNYQVGLVTSSEKIITKELLRLSDSAAFFDFILTRDDTLKVKPDPWPYIHAMEHFKVTPDTVLVFEDSSIGIEAARSSGAHVIKVEWHP